VNEEEFIKDPAILSLICSNNNTEIVDSLISDPDISEKIFNVVTNIHTVAEVIRPDQAAMEWALNWTICAKYMKWHPTPLNAEPLEVLRTAGAALPKQVCQYAFKRNDIVWICKECQTDETCVLCNECFRESKHDGHEVYFYHAQAGGCCDCGDSDAWNKDGFCPHHGRQDTDPLQSFPQPLIEPAKKMIAKVINFLRTTANSVVKSYDLQTIRQRIDDEDRLDGAIVVLHNDDIHETPEVTAALQATYGWDAIKAQEVKKTVDKEGEQIVCCFKANESTRSHPASASEENDAAQFWRNAETLSSRGLLIAVRDRHLVAHVKVAQWLTGWLHGLVKLGDALARLTCGEFSVDLLRSLMCADSRLPPSWAAQLHSLYLSLMADQPFKLSVARAYAGSLALLTENYGAGIGLQERSLYHLSVQFLNRSTFVSDLVENYELLQVLATSLHNVLVKTKKFDCIDTEHSVLRYRRYAPVMGDLKCVLNISGFAQVFLDSCLRHLLDILELINDCHPQVRRDSGAHVEYESRDWMNAFNLSISIGTLFEHLVDWVRTEAPADQHDNRKNSIERIILGTLTRVKDSTTKQFSQRKSEHKKMHPKGTLLLYSLPLLGRSFHNSLTRFLGAFLAEAFKDSTAQAVLADLVSDLAMEKGIVACIIDVPLCVIAMYVEIKAGMWRRNGQIMNDQVMNYAEPPYCKMFRDYDLLLVQFFGLAYGASEMINHLMHRFNVFGFLVDNEPSVLDQASTFVRAEEALLVIIILLTELPAPSENKHSWILAKLKHEVIHQLAGGPATHSQVQECTQFVPEVDKLPPQTLDDVLLEVSDKREASGLDPEKFVLKKEFWVHYDPTFYHISLQAHQKAGELRPEPTSPKALTSVLPVAHPLFNPLRLGILVDCTVQVVVKNILKNALHNPVRCSEVLLVRALDLVTIAVHVCSSEHVESGFRDVYCTTLLEEEAGASVLALLMDLRTSTWAQDKAIKQGLEWILQQLALINSKCQKLLDNETMTGTESHQMSTEERKRKAMERAMIQMKQKAAAFAAEMDMEDSDNEGDTAADEEKKCRKVKDGQSAKVHCLQGSQRGPPRLHWLWSALKGLAGCDEEKYHSDRY